MGLLDDVRAAVATIKTETADLQVLVQHERYLGEVDRAGKRDYATPQARPAIVVKQQKMVRSMAGQMVMAETSITFLDPSVVVQEFDRLVLPDGSTGPILTVEGFIDRGTGKPLLTEVTLGSASTTLDR